MTAITQYQFNGRKVRTALGQHGEALFVGKDVCDNLAYSNHNKAMGDHCKGVVAIYKEIQTPGGVQKMRVLTEAEVLCLLAKSQKGAGAFLEKIISQVKDAKSIIGALEDFEVPDDIPDMYVYAIRNTETGSVKLGISRNPQARLKQLQTGNDCSLELLACRRAENRFRDESALHGKYKDKLVRGEWFNASVAADSENLLTD